MNRDLGNMIHNFLSIAPVTVGAGATEVTTNGTSHSRVGYEWAVFTFTNKQPYGTPLGVTVTCKVQESDDDSTYTDITSASESHNVTNTSTITDISVNLNAVKAYVRGCMVVNFNGGTGPFTVIESTGILGSGTDYPTS